MNNLIPVATLKELGAIEHRINDTTLSPNIKAACIRRSLDNLIETTPRKFHGIILRCRAALDAGDDLELISGIALLRSMIPVTLGATVAGSTVRLPDGRIVIKRKSLLELVSGGTINHLPADTKVTLL